jgi:hypothetical protein
MMMLEEFSPTPAQVTIRQVAARAFDQIKIGGDRVSFILPDAQRDLGFTWSNDTPIMERKGHVGECWMEDGGWPGGPADTLFHVLAHGEEFMFNMKDGCFYRKVKDNG